MKKFKMAPNRLFDIIMGIVLQAVCFLPWIVGNGGYECTLLYFIRAMKAGGVVNLMAVELPAATPASAGIFQVELALLLILQALGLFQLLVSLFRKNSSVLTGVILVLSVGIFYISTNTPPVYMLMTKWSYLYPITVLAAACVAFIGLKLIESWSEACILEKERQEAAKAYREERKRRLRFPGHYPGFFYRVIWKNFVYNRKEYALFLASTVLVVSLIFTGVGLRSMLIANSAGENFMMGQGIGSILFSFILVAMVLAVCLVAFILLFYLKSRMKNLGMFLTLGIRAKTLYLFCALELLSCFVVGVLGGFVMGNVLVAVFRQIILYFMKEQIQMGRIGGGTYLLTVCCVLAVFLVSLVAVHDIYTGMAGYQSKDGAIAKEKVPGRLRKFAMVLGTVFAVSALAGYAKRTAAESVLLVLLFFLGLYLLVRYGGYTILSFRKKQTKKYLEQMVAQNNFYHRFGTTSRYLFVLTVIYISALFLFTVPVASGLSAEPAESLYPYDVVCLANETDAAFFTSLEEELGVEIRTLPMVRATTVDNTPAPDNYMMTVLPQGQNIGISASSYRTLKKWAGKMPEELHLDDAGESIHIVYQQDRETKAHPIDWYVDRQTPYVRIGQPMDAYDWRFRKDLYPPRKVAGVERDSLIGSFSQGSYENLIVFSDAYFAEAEKIVPDGPTELRLMQVPEDALDEVRARLSEFSAAHAADEKHNAAVRSYYIKEDAMKQRITERMMDEIVNLFLVVMLLVVGMFLLHTKVAAELPAFRAKYRFLELLGMREKERIFTLKKEMRPFTVLPLALGGTMALVFTLLTLYLRQFRAADAAAYFRYGAVIYLLYILVQYLDLRFLQHHVLKAVGLGKESGGNPAPRVDAAREKRV